MRSDRVMAQVFHSPGFSQNPAGPTLRGKETTKPLGARTIGQLCLTCHEGMESFPDLPRTTQRRQRRSIPPIAGA
jgi:hypothetical protein